MIDVGFILLAFGLVLVNAFFVAAEFGMVKLRNTRVQTIKNSYGFRGFILEQIHKNLDAYLSACQLGITLASIGLGWIGEPAFAHLLHRMLIPFGIDSPNLVAIYTFLIAFFIISFMHIVMGELMPKSLAIRQPEVVSVWTAIPLYIFYWVMYPAIWFLNLCSNFLLHKSGLDKHIHDDRVYSTKELRLILNASHSHGELTEAETEILENTIDLTDLDVTEVMRPVSEMVILNNNESTQTLLKKITAHRYSRYPIVDPQKEEIIGVVHVKDLLVELLNQKEITSLTAFIRPILKISDELPAMDLLQKFREGMPHFALVYKNKKELLGFITLDNLLHVMIGRIKDEFHKTKDDWVKHADGSIVANGSCSLYSLERALDFDILLSDDEEEMDTIGELIIHRLGHTPPKQGNKIMFNEFEATIEEMLGDSIQKISILPKKIAL